MFLSVLFAILEVSEDEEETEGYGRLLLEEVRSSLKKILFVLSLSKRVDESGLSLMTDWASPVDGDGKDPKSLGSTEPRPKRLSKAISSPPPPPP